MKRIRLSWLLHCKLLVQSSIRMELSCFQMANSLPWKPFWMAVGGNEFSLTITGMETLLNGRSNLQLEATNSLWQIDRWIMVQTCSCVITEIAALLKLLIHNHTVYMRQLLHLWKCYFCFLQTKSLVNEFSRNLKSRRIFLFWCLSDKSQRSSLLFVHLHFDIFP